MREVNYKDSFITGTPKEWDEEGNFVEFVGVGEGDDNDY